MYENKVLESVFRPQKEETVRGWKKDLAGCCPVTSFFEFGDEHLNAIKAGNFLTSSVTMSVHWKPLHDGLSFRLEMH
jgi:hypothetical protein